MADTNGIQSVGPPPVAVDAFQSTSGPNGTRTEPHIWPDFDACTYEALGLSDNWLLDLDLQYPFEEPPTVEGHDGRDIESTGTQGNDINGMVSTIAATTSRPRIDHASGAVAKQIEQEASSNSSKSLLQTFYRMSGHGKVFGLTDEAFVEYYFENVCGIYSCFDSPANPFRSEVENCWTSSPAMYYTIQSMAIGHLANYYPYLAPLGLQKRSQAWEYLQRDLRSSRISTARDDMLLLNLLLLGVSSAWHQASNLGIQYILIARELMQRRLKVAYPRGSDGSQADGRHENFFEDCLLHWEMLISFVDPVPLAPLHVKLELPMPSVAGSSSATYAHPWCGIVSEVQFALAEIGRLLRRRQSYRARLQLAETHSRTSEHFDKEWIESLEAFLLAVEMPQEALIEDYDDVKSSKADFIAMADAYRYVGLLEIYWHYPELLRSRIEKHHATLDGLDLSTGVSLNDDYGRLGVLASHILDLVKPISITSGVCRLMPLIFVAAAGHLRFPSTTNSTEPLQRDEVIHSRYIVEARMLVLSRKYPQKPLLQMTDIIKELWQRLDNGDSNAHWMDVVHELGWQTVMG